MKGEAKLKLYLVRDLEGVLELGIFCELEDAKNYARQLSRLMIKICKDTSVSTLELEKLKAELASIDKWKGKYLHLEETECVLSTKTIPLSREALLKLI